MALTPEEQAELAELEAMESQQSESDMDIDVSDLDDIQDTEIDEIEAVAAGAIQGIPKVGIAGVKALGQELLEDNDFSLQELKEKFDKEKDDLDEWVKNAESQHPTAFTVGDVGAGISAAFIPGTAGLKASVAIGGLSGMARADEAELSDALMGAGFGFIGHKAGQKLGEALDPLSKKIGGMISGKAAQKTGQIPRAFGAVAKKKVHDHLSSLYNAGSLLSNGSKKSITESTQEFGEDVLKRITMDIGDTPEDLLHKVSNQKNILGEQLDSMINKADDVSKLKIDSNDIYEEAKLIIKASMGGDDALKSQQSAAIAALREIDFLRNVDKDGVKVVKDMSLSSLNELRKRVDTVVHSVKSTNSNSIQSLKAKALRDFNSGLRKKIDTAVDSALEGSDEALSGSFKQIKKDWANMNLMENLVGDKVKKAAESPLKEVLTDTFRFGKIARATGTSMLAGPQAGAAIFAIDAITSHPAFPQTQVAALQKLSKFISNNPEHTISKNISRSLTFGADIPELLEQALNLGSAQATLIESPIERTTDALIQNANAISVLLRDDDPELAKQFNDAIRRNDTETLAVLGDQLSKHPDAGEYVKPGKGFDGRVFDPADIAQLATEVDNMDISLKQKLEHKKGLRDSGLIPVVQPEEERFFQVNKRDKNKPAF